MIDILTGTAFDSQMRLNHREDGVAMEFPSSVGSRRRNLLALKAQNWRAARGGAEPADYYGVNLVGSTVALTDGILSGFSNSSYAELPFQILISDFSSFDVCVRVHLANTGEQGIMGGVGSVNGFTPFYNYGSMRSYLYGVGWPAFNGGSESSWVGKDALFRLTWDGGTYGLAVNLGTAWTGLVSTSSSSRVTTANGRPQNLQIGTNRGASYPIKTGGTVDLNYCYLRCGGHLVWEGVAGSAANVARDFPS